MRPSHTWAPSISHRPTPWDTNLLQGARHHRDVELRLVVEETVGEDEPDVVPALGARPVVLVAQPLADGAEVHGLLHDAVVVGEAELDHVHRLLEGPGELVRPDGGHHLPLHVEQLVGGPAWGAGGRLQHAPHHGAPRCTTRAGGTATSVMVHQDTRGAP